MNVTGDKEVDAALKALEAKIGKKVLRQAIRKAAKPLVPQVVNAAPVDTGALKDSIKLKPGKRSRTRFTFFIGPRLEDMTSEETADPFYLGFVEFGTVNYPGRHFVTKTFEANKDITKAALIKYIKEGVDKLK